MSANEWLIVSVRMYVPAISATPSAIAIAVKQHPQLALQEAAQHQREHLSPPLRATRPRSSSPLTDDAPSPLPACAPQPASTQPALASSPRPPSADVLHQVERLLDRGGVAVVDDPPVGEHQQAVGERRRVGVVGDHHDRLVEVVDRVAQQLRAPRSRLSSRGSPRARRRTRPRGARSARAPPPPAAADRRRARRDGG